MTRTLVLTILTAALFQHTLSGEDSLPAKIVIDASKDGGIWWFPQGKEGFDPAEDHQGKGFADYLKSRDWLVEEIPRGEDITTRLEGATIVVRASVLGEYQASEVRAYRDYVSDGGDVVLFQGFVRDGAENMDAVAKEFGITFEKTVRVKSIARWAKHPLTENLDLLPFRIGSVVTATPQSNVPLAYLNKDQLVMGIVNYGKGKVIYVSTNFPLLAVPQPFTQRLIEELQPKRKQ